MIALDLEGKTAVVTGAARGIGQAIAVELAAKGANLVLCDLVSPGDAAETISAITRVGRQPLYRQADVAIAPRWKACLPSALMSLATWTSW